MPEDTRNMEQIIRSLDEIIDRLRTWTYQMQAVIHVVEGIPDSIEERSGAGGSDGAE